MTDSESSDAPVIMVVDVANVMGSRPDGWWRDRASAATKLLAGLSGLVGGAVTAPDRSQMFIDEIVAVVEGAAKAAKAPTGVVVVRAPKDGDSEIVSTAEDFVRIKARVLVVTGDHGLRARLPDGVVVAGPVWLNALLGR